MIDANLLQATLTTLKSNAKPKRWLDPPLGAVTLYGYLFTCCIENSQLVLGISGGSKEGDETLWKMILSIFGMPETTWYTTYPMRGATVLFAWKATLTNEEPG